MMKSTLNALKKGPKRLLRCVRNSWKKPEDLFALPCPCLLIFQSQIFGFIDNFLLTLGLGRGPFYFTMSSIKLSPKYGVNPTLLVCPICGKETGELALLGRIGRKGEDIEAPKYSFSRHICSDCEEHIKQGHRFLIEVEEEHPTKTPTRTGRIATIVNPEALPDLKEPVSYCPKSVFVQLVATQQP